MLQNKTRCCKLLLGAMFLLGGVISILVPAMGLGKDLSTIVMGITLLLLGSSYIWKREKDVVSNKTALKRNVGMNTKEKKHCLCVIITCCLCTIAVGYISWVVVFSQTEVSSRFGGLPSVSPDGHYLTFSVVEDNGSEFHILSLKKQPCEAIPTGLRILGHSWRPNTTPQEMIIYGHDGSSSWQIYNTTVSNGEFSVISSWEIPFDTILSFLSWSPDGLILAAKMTLFNRTAESIVSCLGLSFDDGKSFIETGIKGGYVYWSTNSQLYLYNTNGIYRVEISRQGASVKEVIAESIDAILFGIFKGQVLYGLEDKVYYGDRVIFQADEHLKCCKTSDKYIFLVDGVNLIALNEKGNVMAKWSVGENVEIMEVPSQGGIVYVQRNRKMIERYDIESRDIKPEVIYSLR